MQPYFGSLVPGAADINIILHHKGAVFANSWGAVAYTPLAVVSLGLKLWRFHVAAGRTYTLASWMLSAQTTW